MHIVCESGQKLYLTDKSGGLDWHLPVIHRTIG